VFRYKDEIEKVLCVVGLGCGMSKGLHVVIVECDPIVVMPSHPKALPLITEEGNG
jgi:hypothetical protein